MTEAEWPACTDPVMMGEFLRGNPTSEDTATWWNSSWRIEEAGKGNDRRFRLFACACCRRIWDHIPEACNRDAVATVEGFLDGHVSSQVLQEALVASSAVEWMEDGSGRRSEPGYWAVKYLGRGFYKMTAAASALLVASQAMFMADETYGREARLVFHTCFNSGAGYFLTPFQWPLPLPATVEAERATQSVLLRDIFGNPFRPVPALHPAWLRWHDATIPRLAQQMYDSRDFASMPILADALEEAGCTSADILDHCRGRGPHVRGCWVVDLLLGKE